MSKATKAATKQGNKPGKQPHRLRGQTRAAAGRLATDSGNGVTADSVAEEPGLYGAATEVAATRAASCDEKVELNIDNSQQQTVARAREGWPYWAEAFLTLYRVRGNISQAADSVDVNRVTVHRFRERDKEFAAAMQDAHEEAIDGLEEEARRRAHDGVDKPIYQGGVCVGVVREYSDQLLIELLRGNRSKFRQKEAATNVTVAVAVAVDSGKLKSLQERRAAALERMA